MVTFLSAGRGVALKMMYLDLEDFKCNSLIHLDQFLVPRPSISRTPDNSFFRAFANIFVFYFWRHCAACGILVP